ncbi:MAG: hypothetical protein KJO95_12940 [Gammaproteobacteria bacterium]|nr:hypothetical protein [Gammaproteobacteria bacterium]
MNSSARTGLLAVTALALSACSTLYTLDVSSYSDPSMELDNTYVLLSGGGELDINSPEFDEYAAQIERALEPKGYRRLGEADLETAALGIYVSVGVGDPSKRIHTVSRGFYESPYAENSQAAVRASGNSGAGRGGQSSAQPTPVTPPTAELLTGYEESGFATTVYTKYLHLLAIDFQSFIKEVATVGRANAKHKAVWSIDIETTGQPKDLSEVVPVMVAAGQRYVGDNTEGIVQVKMSGNDKRIEAIKGQR